MPAQPSSPQDLPLWQHERNLIDAKAGIALQVYVRTITPRDPSEPPLVHRSYQIGSVDSRGEVRRYFYARVKVDGPSGIVTVEPFPVDALRALVAQLEREHREDMQTREEAVRRLKFKGAKR
jgi:hypothetical protein